MSAAYLTWSEIPRLDPACSVGQATRLRTLGQVCRSIWVCGRDDDDGTTEVEDCRVDVLMHILRLGGISMNIERST